MKVYWGNDARSRRDWHWGVAAEARRASLQVTYDDGDVEEEDLAAGPDSVRWLVEPGSDTPCVCTQGVCPAGSKQEDQMRMCAVCCSGDTRQGSEPGEGINEIIFCDMCAIRCP